LLKFFWSLEDKKKLRTKIFKIQKATKKFLKNLILHSKRKKNMSENANPPNESRPEILFEACKKGLDSEVRNFLESTTGHFVKYKKTILELAMQFAASKGHLGVVKVLMDHGASTEGSDLKQQPLLLAAHGGHMDVVMYLIERGANLAITCPLGTNALNYAARSKNSELVKKLIGLGMPVNNTNAAGTTPLHDAIFFGDLECVKVLVENGAEITTQKRDKWNHTVLNTACGTGNLGVVVYLVEKLVEQTKELFVIPGNCLVMACFSGNLELVMWLFKDSVSRKTIDGGMLIACKEGHLDVLEWLFKHYAIPPSKKDCARLIHDAVALNHDKLVLLLLENGIDVDSADESGTTALHKTCIRGHLETVELLLLKGANPNKRDIRGATPFHKACDCKKTDIVELMIKNRACVNQADNEGRTPLKIACLAQSLDIVQLLLANGAEPDSDGPKNSSRSASVWNMSHLPDPKPYFRLLFGAGFCPAARMVSFLVGPDASEDHKKKLLPPMSIFLPFFSNLIHSPETRKKKRIRIHGTSQSSRPATLTSSKREESRQPFPQGLPS
jgi:ankyrin repeat protein